MRALAHCEYAASLCQVKVETKIPDPTFAMPRQYVQIEDVPKAQPKATAKPKSFQAAGSAGWLFAGLPEWPAAKPKPTATVQQRYEFAWNEVDERQIINALNLEAVPGTAEIILGRGPLRPPGTLLMTGGGEQGAASGELTKTMLDIHQHQLRSQWHQAAPPASEPQQPQQSQTKTKPKAKDKQQRKGEVFIG